MKPQTDKIKQASGVRKYQRRTPLQRIRQWWMCRRLAACSGDVYVERNVDFMRHPERISLGAKVVVKEGARLCPTNPAASISVGDWTTIGYHTYLFATTKIEIGPNCLIAPFCYLVDANHGIKRQQLIREQQMSAQPIVIEEDVWLGTNVVVLKGVTIGRGAVVSAGAVVSQDVPEYKIVSGSPAQVIDERR